MSEAQLDSPEELLVPYIDFAEVLASYPPGREYPATGFLRVVKYSGNLGSSVTEWKMEVPNAVLYCESDICSGLRVFETVADDAHINTKHWRYYTLTYTCRNCGATEYTFNVAVIRDEADKGRVRKLGQWPPFGPHVPSRVISLIGPDRDLFLKGRRAETQGMGIGAFVYYRRVVENQRNRLLNKVRQVAVRIGADDVKLAQIDSAIDETQFKKSIEMMADAVPEALLVKGHNPLTLLHRALSQGLHAETDEECLELAASIRLVLTDLSERMSIALKSENELDEAVSRLLNK